MSVEHDRHDASGSGPTSASEILRHDTMSVEHTLNEASGSGPKRACASFLTGNHVAASVASASSFTVVHDAMSVEHDLNDASGSGPTSASDIFLHDAAPTRDVAAETCDDRPHACEWLVVNRHVRMKHMKRYRFVRSPPLGQALILAAECHDCPGVGDAALNQFLTDVGAEVEVRGILSHVVGGVVGAVAGSLCTAYSQVHAEMRRLGQRGDWDDGRRLYLHSVRHWASKIVETASRSQCNSF
jgi:hypothetical protein